MNKKLTAAVAVFCILSIIIFIYQITNDQKGFEKLLGTDVTSITKVHMRDGTNGSYVETSDKDRIKAFIELFKGRYYKKSRNQEDKTGYHFSCDLFSGDKLIMGITGDGKTIEINNTYYDVSVPISYDSLTKWFESLTENDSYSITFRGECKDWTAEYKVDAVVSFIDKYGLNRYNAKKTLIVTYKNDLADLAKVKKWEISCEHLQGSTTLSETVADSPLQSKIFKIGCGGSPDSYMIENKDNIIKVSVNMDGNIQKLELKCKQ